MILSDRIKLIMIDNSGTPEKPKIPEGESFSQTWERLKKGGKSKEPTKHFFKDTGGVSEKPEGVKEPETQEERFRLAAIKLALMEDEISERIKDLPHGEINNMEDFFILRFDPEFIKLISYMEDMKSLSGRPAGIKFIDGLVEHVEFGLNTDKSLEIGLHTDEPTYERYMELIKRNPENEYARTIYYFTREGDFKKVSYMSTDLAVDPSRKPLRSTATTAHYESDMTEHDFEIAGQALVMLKKRLEPLAVEGEKSGS